LTGRIKGCLLIAFSRLMRRAYPTSFCFQEAIEIILQRFFHSFNVRGGSSWRQRLAGGFSIRPDSATTPAGRRRQYRTGIVDSGAIP
jgi:hypothetical protein